MKKLKLLLTAFALLGGVISVNAQMTDVTDTYLTNAGFETDEAAATLSGSQQNTPTGWTISPSSLSNTQWGTANSSTTIQGYAATQTPSAGDKYFYFRDNWQSGTNISVSQASKAEVPAGNYIVYFDVFTYSSNATQPVYSFTVGDGSTTYVNGSITANKNAWATYYYHFKLDAAATLTFSANMTPKAAASGKHDWMLLDNIRLLKADNPQTPVVDNTADLYLRNEATGLYLSAGKSWGTHATVDNYGQEITANLPNGHYTLKTQQYNKYLGGLYMDANSGDWLFLGTGEDGKYYLTQDGYNYMTSNGAGEEVINVTSPTAASVWTVVSKADRKTALASATVDNPGNATFLIGDANFSRNCLTTPWTKTNSGGDFQFSNGANDNMNMQQWNGTFTLTQSLTDLPNGAYKLTAQGFYRNGGNSDAASAYNGGTETIRSFLTANSETPVPIMSVMADAQGSSTGGFTTSTDAGYVPNSQSNASACFSAGYYKDNVIWVAVTDGNLTIGAKCDENVSNAWTVLDNFELTYYGDVTINEAKNAALVKLYNDAMDEAKAFTEVSMFAADWTTLQSAITANTLDLDDPGLTESDITTATANLVAANTAATAAVNSKTTYNTAVTTIDGGTNVNLTSLIVNPSFESDFTGWTNTGSMAIQTNTSFAKTGSKYAEYWEPNGTKGVSQTISVLPAGIYKLSLDCKARGVTSAKIFANSDETAVVIEDKQNNYVLTFEIADKTAINIGFEGVCTGAGSSWLALDNFQLTYVGTINDLTYTLATGKMGTDKSTAQSTAEATFLGEKTLANYNALLAAIAEAEASKVTYDNLKAAIDKAQAVKDANNFVTAAATTALTAEISTATTAWTNVTYTDAQATSEIATLGSAVSGWHGIGSEGKAGAYIASTWGKTNENWWDAPYINTWSTEGDNDGSGFSVPFFEYFISETNNLAANTFTATLSGLDNGAYEVELWARVQRRTDANFNGDNSMITMSVNSGDAVSIMNGDNIAGYDDSHTMRLGRFTARGMVTDGTLTLSIDVKLGSNVHWLCWRDVTYTKLPDNVSVTVSDADFATYVNSDYDLDFSATSIEAYKVKVNTKGVATLTKVNEVPAGTPVLLYADGGATEDIPVIASAGAVTENDLVAGTGAAVPTTDGAGNTNMILNNVGGNIGFYFAADQTVATNRAYLHIDSGLAPTAESRMVMVFADEATGISTVKEAGFMVDGYYDLQGRRVTQPAKGLYIVNGKKVVIK